MDTDFGSLIWMVETDSGSTVCGVEEVAKGWPNSPVLDVCWAILGACGPARTAGCVEDCGLDEAPVYLEA